MTVKELIEELQKHPPEMEVIGADQVCENAGYLELKYRKPLIPKTISCRTRRLIMAPPKQPSASAELKRLTAKAKREKLENRFAFLWKTLGGPKLEREVEFNSDRKWRIDFVFRSISSPETYDLKLGIEIEGGQWVGGRHGTGTGFTADAEKYFAATVIHGYTVVRLTSEMIDHKHLKPLIQLTKASP